MIASAAPRLKGPCRVRAVRRTRLPCARSRPSFHDVPKASTRSSTRSAPREIVGQSRGNLGRLLAAVGHNERQKGRGGLLRVAVAERLARLCADRSPRRASLPLPSIVTGASRISPNQDVGVRERRWRPTVLRGVDVRLARGQLEVEVQRPGALADGLVQEHEELACRRTTPCGGG